MQELNGIYLSALRSIDTVARLGTLKAAANALGVTPGAVSQQIIKAEAQLGCRLFERTPRGMVLTPIGQQVSDHLSEGFHALNRAVLVAKERRSQTITVSVPPIFAGKWLVWRLNRFTETYPEIKIRIVASVDLIDPRTGEADVCIRVGKGNWSGVKADALFPQRVFPVCAPSMADRLRTLDDLQHVPIIRDMNAMSGWDVWLKPNEMDEDTLSDGPEFSDAALCLDATIAGHGVFLAWETLAQDALAMGQLVAPFPGRFKTGNSYWFVEPRDQLRPAEVEAFRTWLVGELAAGHV